MNKNTKFKKIREKYLWKFFSYIFCYDDSIVYVWYKFNKPKIKVILIFNFCLLLCRDKIKIKNVININNISFPMYAGQKLSGF